jgi:hypothetical protein
MWIRPLLALVASGLLGSHPSAADEALYDVRGPAIPPGIVIRSTSKSTCKPMRLTYSFEGVPRSSASFDFRREGELNYVVEAAEDRQVTRARVRIVKNVTTFIMTRGDEEVIDHKVDRLEGREIISELGKNGWTHRLAEGQPTEEEKEALRVQSEFEDENWYPKGKIRIGATWAMPPLHLARAFAPGDEVKVTGDLKTTLVEVRNFEGDPCAVIRTTGPVRGTFRREGQRANLELELETTEFRSLRTYVALRFDIRCDFKQSGPVKVGNEVLEETVEGTMNDSYRTTVVEKAAAQENP